ncbi:hypothetical protein SAMN05216367_4315 [Tardiphaga sp. OK245]|nr:hypothetical protein SAMN05216367_4315 [Tardiphaga sp. OK245]
MQLRAKRPLKSLQSHTKPLKSWLKWQTSNLCTASRTQSTSSNY